MPETVTTAPKHIGIVAASPEGSALAYRELFRIASRLIGDHGHPRVSLHNEPLEDYLDAVVHGDWQRVGDLLAISAKKLAAIGAECVMTPDNLMQHGVHLAETGSPIPWLKMTDFVAEAIVADGRTAVGLIGTKPVMYGSTYQTVLGLKGVKVIPPQPDDAEMIDRVIFDELVHGVESLESRKQWIAVINRLAAKGAQGVILGATEVPLLIRDQDSPLPVYNSTALLAEGVLRYALGLSRKG